MRLFTSLVALFLALSAATAQAFSVDEVRVAVAARNFYGLDQGLQDAQADFLGGARSADDIRALYVVLSRSAPDTVAFVKDWLTRAPDNPRAQIARTWSLYEAAGHIREGRNAHSYKVARAMHAEMRTLATAAYQSAPALIPVSDAIIRSLGTVDDAKTHPFEVMNRVLIAHPNWGTVERALTKGYLARSSVPLLHRFCEGAASHFPPADIVALRHRCLMRIGTTYDAAEIETYVHDHLWSDTATETTLDRLSFFIRKTDITKATDAQISWAKGTLFSLPAGPNDLLLLGQLTQELESHLRRSGSANGWGLHDFKKARLSEAEVFLSHDPLNIGLLNFVQDVAFAPDWTHAVNPDGSTSLTPIEVVRSPAEQDAYRREHMTHRHDFNLRRLRASPYSSDAWLDLAQFVSGKELPGSLFDGDGAYGTAVFFADDPASVLTMFIRQKRIHWEKMNQFDGTAPQQTQNAPAWRRFFAKVDKESAVICPYLRAILLRAQVCQRYDNAASQCQQAAFLDPEGIAALAQTAKATPACAALLEADFETLWYTPVNISEAIADFEGLGSER